MSSRQKKIKREKQQEHKAPKEKPLRPAGKAPEAMVTSRHGTGVVTRTGKGFSMGELAGAGLSSGLASAWGVRLDPRRRSMIDTNVASLKSWGAHPSPARKAESRAKKAEEEIEKVGKEVEKEAVRVEKKAEKVEGEIKKEAAKAKEAVRRKAKKKAES
ncbi:MAG TPA: ribosomal protein L13e [Nitrososphaerales archaeon]|nr:ribosomal protein L13e [Nitrososphaerales archaeon]